MKLIDTNFAELKKYYSEYIETSKKVGDNAGPSLHFHKRALYENDKNFLSDIHLEMIYATLTSWGMHKMGKTKTKMTDFENFKNAILVQKKQLIDFSKIKIEEISNRDFESIIIELNKICFSLEVSTSNSKIVGNSKTLAHILPNLVPPIDRQYTILFFTTEPSKFFSNKNKLMPAPNFKGTKEEKIEVEKKCFTYIMHKTFDFINHIKDNKQIKIEAPLNTSYPKIFDNFIMTYIKTLRENQDHRVMQP